MCPRLKITVENEFRALCNKHNMLYMHTNVYKEWAKGVISMRSIELLAKALSKEVASRIWNEEVDNKINGLETRRSLYWDY